MKREQMPTVVPETLQLDMPTEDESDPLNDDDWLRPIRSLVDITGDLRRSAPCAAPGGRQFLRSCAQSMHSNTRYKWRQLAGGGTGACSEMSAPAPKI